MPSKQKTKKKPTLEQKIIDFESELGAIEEPPLNVSLTNTDEAVPADDSQTQKGPKVKVAKSGVKDGKEKDGKVILGNNPSGSILTKKLTEETTPTTTWKEYVPDPNHTLEVRTSAGKTFKDLLDSLKAVLTRGNIIFTDKGLKFAAVDKNRHALVHLVMEASNFTFYHLKKPRLVLGVDIEQLHRSIRTNKLNDQMCFVLDQREPAFLQVSYDNPQKKSNTVDKIRLLNLEESNFIDEMEYRQPPQMDSHDFQGICREMAGFRANYIEISRVKEELIFRNLDGDTFRTVRVEITPTETVYNFDTQNDGVDNAHGGENKKEDDGAQCDPSEPEEEASGIFLLKFLKSFAKAANLSPHFNIYLRNNAPLICEYNVAGLGTLRYVLSPEDVEVVEE
jgi:proliferating cell nuclear antigen PCNA